MGCSWSRAVDGPYTSVHSHVLRCEMPGHGASLVTKEISPALWESRAQLQVIPINRRGEHTGGEMSQTERVWSIVSWERCPERNRSQRIEDVEDSKSGIHRHSRSTAPMEGMGRHCAVLQGVPSREEHRAGTEHGCWTRGSMPLGT